MPDEIRHEPIEQELDSIARSIGGEEGQRPIQSEMLELILLVKIIEESQERQSHGIKELAEQAKIFSAALSDIDSKLDTLIQAVIPPTETVSFKFGAPTPKKEK